MLFFITFLEIHVLQRRFGCEVEKHQNGSVSLFRAIEEYGFDGEDFITFDADGMQWRAEVPKAQTIKRAWDKEKKRMNKVQNYLKKECKENLFRYLDLAERKTPCEFLTNVWMLNLQGT